MSTKITTRQREVLECIDDLMTIRHKAQSSPEQNHPRTPTVRDIATVLSLAPSSTHKHLRALADKGMIVLPGNTRQGIDLGPGLLGMIDAPIVDHADLITPTITKVQYEKHIMTMSFPLGMFTDDRREGLRRIYILSLEHTAIIAEKINKDDLLVIRPFAASDKHKITGLCLVAATINGRRMTLVLDEIAALDLYTRRSRRRENSVVVSPRDAVYIGRILGLIRKGSSVA